MAFIETFYINLYEFWLAVIVIYLLYAMKSIKEWKNISSKYYFIVNFVFYSYFLFLLFFVTNSLVIECLNTTFYLSISKLGYSELQINYLIVVYIYLFVFKKIFLLLEKFNVTSSLFLFVLLQIYVVFFFILYYYKNVAKEIFNTLYTTILNVDVEIIIVFILFLKILLIIEFVMFSFLFFIEQEYSNLKFAYTNDLTIILYLFIIGSEMLLNTVNKNTPLYFENLNNLFSIIIFLLWFLNNFNCLEAKLHLPCNFKQDHLKKLKEEEFSSICKKIDQNVFAKLRPYYWKIFFDQIKKYQVCILVNTIMLPAIVVFFFPLAFFDSRKIIIIGIFIILAYGMNVASSFPTIKKYMTRAGIGCCTPWGAFRGVFFQRIHQVYSSTKVRAAIADFLKRADEKDMLTKMSVGAGVVVAFYAAMGYHDKTKPVIKVEISKENLQELKIPTEQTTVADFMSNLEMGYDLDIKCLERNTGLSARDKSNLLLIRNEKFSKDLKQVHNELTALGIHRVPVGFKLETVASEERREFIKQTDRFIIKNHLNTLPVEDIREICRRIEINQLVSKKSK